jgi:hypothetical protein
LNQSRRAGIELGRREAHAVHRVAVDAPAALQKLAALRKEKA